MSIDTREPIEGRAAGTLAREVLKGEAIVLAMGTWLQYDAASNHYREMDDKDIKSLVWRALDGRTVLVPGKDGVEEQTLNLTTSLSADVREAMISQVLANGVDELPFWHNAKESEPDPKSVIPVANGLIEWRRGALLKSTPRFVSTSCSPLEFDMFADDPVHWDRFLEDIFQGDKEQIDLLHEVLGCIISGQNKYQKVFQLFGPPRSGKGTIGRMLVELLGKEAVASPKIRQISEGGFGLQALIGKTVAVIGDARIDRGKQSSALTEILLTTSGGDLQTIQRKFRDDFIGYLHAQWLLMSNEPVLMHDLTGTIATRMVMMETRKSFLGKEDVDIFQRDLLPEASGVLNRCLDGAQRLADRGHFLIPASIVSRQKEILREASTVAAFASECLLEDPNARTPKAKIYETYERYCRGHSRSAAAENIFWRDLRTSGKFRDAMVQRPNIDGQRTQVVMGLGVSLDDSELPFQIGDDFED